MCSAAFENAVFDHGLELVDDSVAVFDYGLELLLTVDDSVFDHGLELLLTVDDSV